MRLVPHLALPGVRLPGAASAAARVRRPDYRGVQVWHFTVHWLGADFGAPRYGDFEPYDVYSGLLGLSFATVWITLLRRHACHVRWCWRLGRHLLADPAAGAEYRVCGRHHPHAADRGLTRAHLRAIHARHRVRG